MINTKAVDDKIEVLVTDLNTFVQSLDVSNKHIINGHHFPESHFQRIHKNKILNLGRTFILTHARPTCVENFIGKKSQHVERGRRVSQA